jgi:hypothetical protein
VIAVPPETKKDISPSIASIEHVPARRRGRVYAGAQNEPAGRTIYARATTALSAAAAVMLERAVGPRPERPTEKRLFFTSGALVSGMRIMLVRVVENERP